VAHIEFNISLGREVEFYNNVDSNTPANSALVMMILAASGLETDEVLRDKDSFAAIVSGTTNEVTNTNYARKVLTDANLSAYTVDDVSDSVTLSIPVQTFTTILTGDTWAKSVLGYDPDTTGGTDSDIIPIVAHDLIYQGSYLIPAGDNLIIDLSGGYIVVSSKP
jgi:hypothetical protein